MIYYESIFFQTNYNSWFYSSTQFCSSTLDIFKRHWRAKCAVARMWNLSFFPLQTNHYLYNIAALIKGNPLPSASHVPASASDANRIRKQDLSPPFTFCSFQPRDIILSSIPMACFIIWHSWFLPSQVLVTILVLHFYDCCGI